MIEKINLIAYEERDPKRIFVAVPDERGRYVLTDRCVAYVSCPTCGAVRFEPCKGHGSTGRGSSSGTKYTSGTHYERKSLGAVPIRRHRFFGSKNAPKQDDVLEKKK